jgi:tetratricopeptide (TPR) repeat protein
MPENSDSSFSSFLKDFRKGLGVTQAQLADILDYARGVIANAEAGNAPSRPLIDRLVEKFPDRGDEILKAYDVSAQRQRVSEEKTPLEQEVDTYISAGELKLAKLLLESELRNELDMHSRFIAFEYLGSINADLNNLKGSASAFYKALQIGEKLYPGDSRLIPLIEQVIICDQRDRGSGSADRHLDEALIDYPASHVLWRRKGFIHADRGAYSSAYAAFGVALQYGSPKLEIARLRGTCLILGRSYANALIELEVAFTDPKMTPEERLGFRILRAHALAQTGETDRALREFGEVEHAMPFNPWLHYYRALCYIQRGNVEYAIDGFIAALDSELHESKQRPAITWLKFLRYISRPTTDREEAQALLQLMQKIGVWGQ